MTSLPSQHEQIIQAHAALIVNTVRATQNPSLRPPLEDVLKISAENGWGQLVNVIRRILDGARETDLLAPLDEEDRVIAAAILRGLQDPSTLPDPTAKPDPVLAAPGLAAMIHACRRGDAQALQLLPAMAEQMTRAGGDLARLGGIMRRLVDGETDPEKLSKGMTGQGESLLLALLAELARLELH